MRSEGIFFRITCSSIWTITSPQARKQRVYSAFRTSFRGQSPRSRVRFVSWAISYNLGARFAPLLLGFHTVARPRETGCVVVGWWKAGAPHLKCRFPWGRRGVCYDVATLQHAGTRPVDLAGFRCNRDMQLEPVGASCAYSHIPKRDASYCGHPFFFGWMDGGNGR